MRYTLTLEVVDSLERGQRDRPPLWNVDELSPAEEMSTRLLEQADLLPAYPGTVGMSGMVDSTLSSSRLNLSTGMPERFLIFCGIELNSLGPLMAKLFSLMFTVFAEHPVLRTRGTLQ